MRRSKKGLRQPPRSRAQPSTSPTRRAGMADGSDQVLPRAARSTRSDAATIHTTLKAARKAPILRRRRADKTAMESVYGGTEVPRGLKPALRARSLAGGSAGLAEKLRKPP